PGSRRTQAKRLSPEPTSSIALAPVNPCSWRPVHSPDRCPRGPEPGAGSAAIQSQPSPPSGEGTAPDGRAPSIHATTALSAAKEAAAKARRPSGHSTSASTHCGPLFTGEKV